MTIISVPITLNENDGLCRKSEPVTMGVPFSKGVVENIELLSLYSSGEKLPCQIKTTAIWNDASIKWVLLDFQIDLAANSEKCLTLSNEKLFKNSLSDEIKQESLIKIEEFEHFFSINTGCLTFHLNKTELKPFDKIIQDNYTILDNGQSAIILNDQNDKLLTPLIKTIEINHEENCLSLTANIKGHFVSSENKNFVNFSTVLTFYVDKATVKWDFTLHNPNMAYHKGNLWDLGDQGSIYFKQLDYQLNFDSVLQMDWKDDVNSKWEKSQSNDFVIYQDSSGGEHWNSKNHINKEGIVPVKFKGYQCLDKQVLSHSGDRANPFIHIKAHKLQLTAHIKQFWQNFPKAIAIKNKSVNLSLFPEQFADVFELQGGEKKTHTLFLNFDEDKSALDYCQCPLVAKIAVSYYAQTNVFPWLPNTYAKTGLDKLIQAGIEGDNNFFSKREIIDEYGWRNFGDIFADHESLYNKNNRINISHYNNQYDPIYGFARQFVLTGEQKWFELMSDLAQHVVDIDIYHTKEDRHEYNGALFWHTTHYVDVATCTHRSYSQAHLNDDPYAGGGPGDEHCYAMGLAAHYFLTGSTQSKQAVLKLADWMIKLHEGNGGFFERLLQFKQTDLPVLKQVIKGSSIPKHKYPFHRGIGNYINCLLDAYNVTSDYSYVLKIEKIIRLTIHPDDDITKRKLEEIEPLEAPANWSYTILLQAIIKYLQIKITIDEIDQKFYYAKDSLIHYADWMLKNEYPYLEKPEILEFPNHTWVAQDIRKAYILSIAANFNKKQKELYLEKAEYFFSYVVENLKSNNTRTYSRILAVLMQNHFDIKQINLSESLNEENFSGKPKNTYSVLQHYTIQGILGQLVVDLGKRLVNLSLKREIKWLKLRTSSFKN